MMRTWKQRRALLSGLVMSALVGLGAATPARADFEAIRAYYVDRGNAFPPTRLELVEKGRDAGIFEKLQIRAVLAVVKYELARKRMFPELSVSDRKDLLRIISDPNLELVFTGKQSLLAHTTGCQTVSKTLINCHHEAFYTDEGARAHHYLGRILLHEMGHVYQQRHMWFSSIWIPAGKETFPLSLEDQLPAANFTPEIIAKVTKLINGELDEPPLESSSLECGPADAMCIGGFDCSLPTGCYTDCVCVAQGCADNGLGAECSVTECTRWEWREVCN